MLQILVNFSRSNTRVVEKSFRHELDKLVKNSYSHFSDSHYTLCHISDTELMICISLCSKYSMSFATDVCEITEGMSGVLISSVNYFL